MKSGDKMFTGVNVISNYMSSPTQLSSDGWGSTAAAQIQDRLTPTHCRVIQEIPAQRWHFIRPNSRNSHTFNSRLLWGYLESACPPGQYMAQYGSSKGHSSGLSLQNLQLGVNSRSLTSGVRLCSPTTSVFSAINLRISDWQLTEKHLSKFLRLHALMNVLT